MNLATLSMALCFVQISLLIFSPSAVNPCPPTETPQDNEVGGNSLLS